LSAEESQKLEERVFDDTEEVVHDGAMMMMWELLLQSPATATENF
jgi:hypothetical protein